MHTSRTAVVDLYWIPLGAGGHSVRFNGRVFEAVETARQHRNRCDLYHAALVVELDADHYAIELAPSPDADEASRDVVATGAVGSRCLGRLRLFRCEVRCSHGGSIPDLGEAVGGPRRPTSDPGVARRLLDLVGAALVVPAATSGAVGDGSHQRADAGGDRHRDSAPDKDAERCAAARRTTQPGAEGAEQCERDQGHGHRDRRPFRGWRR